MKKHPYILAIIIATLLSIVVWLVVPKEYTAITKLRDEYKEVDLAIGLNEIKAQLKNISGKANKGVNDIEVYCRFLKSEDFARTIAHTKVHGKNMTYGAYLGEKDTIDAVLDNINYNLSSKNQTVIISFTDRDALVAAQMLDSVTTHLQSIITDHRHQIVEAALQNAAEELEECFEEYHLLQDKYAAFVDSHKGMIYFDEIEEEKTLKKELDLSYRHLKNILNEYVRQLALQQRDYTSFAIIRANTVPQEDNSHPFGLWAAFTFIALVLAFWLKRIKEQHHKWDIGKLSSPWAITIAVWAVIIILIQSSDIMDPISDQFWISFCLWIPIFCISSFVTYNLTKGNKISGFDSMSINTSWYYLFFALALILTPMYLYKTYTMVSMFDTKDLMFSIRQWSLYGDNYGYLNYAQPILQATVVVSLWKFRSDGVKWWHTVILILAYLLFSLGKMEKLGMFFGFVYLAYVLFEKRVIKIRTIAIVGAALLVAFYFFNLSRQGEDSDYAKNESLSDFIGMYIMSGAVAYGKLQQNISDIFGSETLNTFYTYFYKWFLGEQFEAEGVGFREFVSVPIPTNVYTIFCPFFCDYGQKGVAFFALVMGTLTGWLYGMSRGDSILFKCLYTIMVCVLIMQFFDDIFIVPLMTYIHTTILLVLMTQKRIKFG